MFTINFSYLILLPSILTLKLSGAAQLQENVPYIITNDRLSPSLSVNGHRESLIYSLQALPPKLANQTIGPVVATEYQTLPSSHWRLTKLREHRCRFNSPVYILRSDENGNNSVSTWEGSFGYLFQFEIEEEWDGMYAIRQHCPDCGSCIVSWCLKENGPHNAVTYDICGQSEAKRQRWRFIKPADLQLNSDDQPLSFDTHHHLYLKYKL